MLNDNCPRGFKNNAYALVNLFYGRNFLEFAAKI
jgi:hypothetical protein